MSRFSTVTLTNTEYDALKARIAALEEQVRCAQIGLAKAHLVVGGVPPLPHVTVTHCNCGAADRTAHRADCMARWPGGFVQDNRPDPLLGALAARDAEIVKLRERPMQTDLDQANEVIAARDARIQELTEQYFSYREAAGASIGADVNQQAIDRILQLEKALGEIRGCAWIDKHGLERYNLLKIESILNDAIGPPKDRTSQSEGKV